MDESELEIGRSQEESVKAPVEEPEASVPVSDTPKEEEKEDAVQETDEKKAQGTTDTIPEEPALEEENAPVEEKVEAAEGLLNIFLPIVAVFRTCARRNSRRG